MKYQAKLTISHYAGGANNAFFETTEAGKKALEAFATQLAKIKEFGNRDEDPIFRFEAAGAFYAIDLRKVTGAALEICEPWADVCEERHLETLKHHKSLKQAAQDRGLLAEFELLNEPKPLPAN